MKQRRVVAILMALVLLVCMASLVACGGKDSASSSTSGGNSTSNGSKSSDSSADEKLVVRWLYADNASYPLQDDWLILEEIEKATGVDLELIVVPDSDYVTKQQLIFNSGDLPEVIYSKNAASSEDAMNGLLLPIDKYLHLMPNLSAFLDEYNYAEDMDNFREADGHFYTLPMKADTVRMRTHTWLVRVDLFEKHGIPLPKTLDDVYEAGVKLKELYPNSYPIINRFGADNIMGMVGSGFGTLAGWALTANGYIYDEEKDSWIFAPTSPKFKELLMYMNKLLDAGVLDPEFISLDSAAYEQRVVQGDTFILADWVGNQVRYNLEGTVENPDFNVQPIFPVTGPSGDFALERASLFEQFGMISAAIVDHPRFEEILAFIDWFYTEEAAIITTFGKEGVSYEKEGDRLVFKDLTQEPTMTYGVGSNALVPRRHPDFFYARNGTEIAELFDRIADAEAVQPPDPKVRYTEDELDELKFLTPPVNDYYESMIEQFIFGKESFDNWDTYVQECERKGSLEIGKVINGAWQRQQQQQQ